MQQPQPDIRAIGAEVEREAPAARAVLDELAKRLVGQRNMAEKLLLGLLTGGHVLLEGVPGLAKTLAVRTLAECIDAGFKRLQFTPDLLPSDLVGTLVFDQKRGEFTTRKGPIFANIVLADEVNRAPAKVQSALLEAMQERQVTIGDETFALPDPFLVLATENPIEQEGTYPLPEAQVDRFLFKVVVDYPARDEEKEIVRRSLVGDWPPVAKVLDPARIARLRGVVRSVYVDEKATDYVVDLVFATRDPASRGLDAAHFAFGASPRASIHLAEAARAHAFLDGRPYVTPEDVRLVGMEVLRHRVVPSYEAEAEGITADALVERVFEHVPVP